MERLQNDVDIPSLPQVFQDAIQIAYYLGIDYLWIDALCIKQDQDDRSDWEIEAQNMSRVYSCALLNISATLSSDGSESLFQERPRDPLLPLKVDLDINGNQQTYYVLNDNIWDEEITLAPLNQRGWVFQERFLARRVVHFGQRQMAWECHELDTLEMFPKGLPEPSTLSFNGKSVIYDKLAALSRQPDQILEDQFVDQWQDLVTKYSQCRLTYPKDKLIAFSGIAKRIREARADYYAAGMWQKSMICDLPWWRTSADRDAFPINQTSFRAPSWSWASVDGEINFPAISQGDPLADILEISAPVTNRSGVFDDSILIQVRGICLPFSVEWSNKDISSFKVDGLDFPMEYDLGGTAVDLESSEQEMQEWIQQGTILLLPLFFSIDFLHGILLRGIYGESTHRRIGAIEISREEDRNNNAAILEDNIRCRLEAGRTCIVDIS